MYASSSSADKYGTGRTGTTTSTKYHRHLHHSGSSSYLLTEPIADRRSGRSYNSVPRLQAAPSALASRSSATTNAAARLTDVNGNIRSLSLTKGLSPSYSSTTAALLLGNDKRYDATKKRLDAFYCNSRSPSLSLSSSSSSSLNKSYNYRAAGDLSYFEKYNKQQQQQTPDDPQPHAVCARHVNVMSKSKYGATDNGTAALQQESSSSSSSYGSDSKKSGVVGIRNIGNTCYMNSVLQCLSNTKGLTDSVLDDADRWTDGKLIRVYRDLLSRIWSGGNDGHPPVDTTAFKSAFQRLSPRFAGYEQQDSQEFLRLLLDRLHMDVNRVKVKPRGMPDPDETLKDNALAAHFWQRYLATDNSTVVDLFAGQLKSTLECSVCGHKSITFEVRGHTAPAAYNYNIARVLTIDPNSRARD